MKTQTKYEEIILHEIRSMPTPLLPQALKILQSLKVGVLSVARHQSVAGISHTGFCGAWQDDRSAEEIIADIEATEAVLAEEGLTCEIPAGYRHLRILAQGERTH